MGHTERSIYLCTREKREMNHQNRNKKRVTHHDEKQQERGEEKYKKFKSNNNNNNNNGSYGTYMDIVNDLNDILNKKRETISSTGTSITTSNASLMNKHVTSEKNTRENEQVSIISNEEQKMTEEDTGKQQMSIELHPLLNKLSNHPLINPQLFKQIQSGHSLIFCCAHTTDMNNNGNRIETNNPSVITDSMILTLLLASLHLILKCNYSATKHGTGILIVLPTDFSLHYWYHSIIVNHMINNSVELSNRISVIYSHTKSNKCHGGNIVLVHVDQILNNDTTVWLSGKYLRCCVIVHCEQHVEHCLLSKLSNLNSLKKQLILFHMDPIFHWRDEHWNFMKPNQWDSYSSIKDSFDSNPFQLVKVPYNDKLYSLYLLLKRLCYDRRQKVLVIFENEYLMSLIYYIFNRLYKSSVESAPLLFLKTTITSKGSEHLKDYEQWYYSSSSSNQSSVLFTSSVHRMRAIPVSKCPIDTIILYDCYGIHNQLHHIPSYRRCILMVDVINNGNESPKSVKELITYSCNSSNNNDSNRYEWKQFKDRTNKYYGEQNENHSSVLLEMQSAVNKSQLIRKFIQLNLEHLHEMDKNQHFLQLVLSLFQRKNAMAKKQQQRFDARNMLPLKELMKQFCIYNNIQNGYYDYMELLSKKIEELLVTQYEKQI
jgi:hypothetical protein